MGSTEGGCGLWIAEEGFLISERMIFTVFGGNFSESAIIVVLFSSIYAKLWLRLNVVQSEIFKGVRKC